MAVFGKSLGETKDSWLKDCLPFMLRIIWAKCHNLGIMLFCFLSIFHKKKRKKETFEVASAKLTKTSGLNIRDQLHNSRNKYESRKEEFQNFMFETWNSTKYTRSHGYRFGTLLSATRGGSWKQWEMPLKGVVTYQDARLGPLWGKGGQLFVYGNASGQGPLIFEF